jgi:hypothetical protein
LEITASCTESAMSYQVYNISMHTNPSVLSVVAFQSM